MARQAVCPVCGKAFLKRTATTMFCSTACVREHRATPSPGESLLDLFPEIAAEADGWDPSKVVPGSNKKMNWVCREGHQWSAFINNRTKVGTRCPYCIGRLAIPGETDLATTHPNLAAQSEGWDPSTIGAGSGLKVSWRCEQGHVWVAQVELRAKRGYGCPYCSGHRVVPGVSDLATTHPFLAAQADGWDPSGVMAGTNKKLKWICERGHRWSATSLNRMYGQGCPICANRVVLRGFNDLATTHPFLAAQADGWDPTTVVMGSGTPRNWKCDVGHTWTTSCNSRTSQNLGCPYCGNQKVWPGFNDLATTHPFLAAQADGWDPTSVSAGSNKRVRWQCSEGHHWIAMLSDRKAGAGCPTCAKFGFDPNKDGYLYFLEHEEWDMLQIGITNVPKKRLQKHRRGGWLPVEIRGPMDGHLTRQLETGILRALKIRGAKLGRKAGRGEFDGWSESWLRDSLPVTTIRELIDFVYEDG
jgi:hypothetical protein